MWIIAGLGNPGPRYRGTRHNIGFDVVERAARICGALFRAGAGAYEEASCTVGGEEVLFIEPLTFMNRSGSAVREVVETYQAPLERLIVVYDDFHLPLGSLRIRLQGSDGGHNGLASVIEQLHSSRIPRIRCGIGSGDLETGDTDVVAFVLSRFSPEELGKKEELVREAADAVLDAVKHGVPSAMNSYNRRRI